jgi:hypothetical protein
MHHELQAGADRIYENVTLREATGPHWPGQVPSSTLGVPSCQAQKRRSDRICPAFVVTGSS